MAGDRAYPSRLGAFLTFWKWSALSVARIASIVTFRAVWYWLRLSTLKIPQPGLGIETNRAKAPRNRPF